MDIFTLILIPFLLGIFTNRVDDILVASRVDEALKRLRKEDKRSNQELEKSLRVCFLSALQTIVRECHQELMGTNSVQRYRGALIYPPEHQDELQWLDTKLKQLVRELKLVKRNVDITNPLQSIDDIALLLSPEKLSIATSIQLVKEKLIAEALKEGSDSQCYATKVEAVLFDLVKENFTLEVQHNPVLREIVETKLLATLASQKLEIPGVVTKSSLSAARRTVKLELDIEQLDAARLEAIVQHLQKLLDDGSIKLRRIEEGCMELIFDGSEESLKKLDVLFKSGQLREILDIPVQDVYDEDVAVSLPQPVVNLSQWLQNVFDSGWQTLEEVLGTRQEQLIFARSGVGDSVIRAEQIQLAIPSSELSLALVVAVKPTSVENRNIRLQVHSITNKILPQGLQCNVLDISGNNILKVQAQNNDKSIQLDINGQSGEEFSVQIQIDNAKTVRNFMI
jgi:hypothetical protein